MKMALYDTNGFYALQHTILENKHQLFVQVDDVKTTVSSEDFNVTPIQTKKFKRTLSVEELLATNSDLYILPRSDLPLYEEFSILYPGRVIGHSRIAQQMEENRVFSYKILSKWLAKPAIAKKFPSVKRYFRLPKQRIFATPQRALAYLRSIPNKAVVLKEATNSDGGAVWSARTLISHPPHTVAIATLKETTNSWFTKGCGAVIMEDFVTGYEVAFGTHMYIDSRKGVGIFADMPYVYTEHKGAQNGNRGSILTGEVGSSVTWPSKVPKNPFISEFFALLAHIFREEGMDLNGMVDFNTIYDPKANTFHLLEFTMRYGRPALEVMICAMNQPNAYLKMLSEAAYLSSNKLTEAFQNALFGKYPTTEVPRYLHINAIAVYPYGHPFLYRYTEEKGVDLANPLLYPVHFTLPDGPAYSNYSGRYSQEFKCYITEPNAVQFLVCGRSTSDRVRGFEEARLTSYQNMEVIEQQHLFGLTWRDDIGIEHGRMLQTLATKGYI